MSILKRSKRISRRDFLKAGGVATLGTLAAAYGFSPMMRARAQDIAGTNFTVFLGQGSIPEAQAVQDDRLAAWAEEADVNLTVETLALAEWATRLATMAEIGAGADLINMYQQHVGVNASILTDVTDLVEELEETLGDFFEPYKSVAYQDGKWIAIPAAVYGQYWHFRTDLFAEAGVDSWPTTWEELHTVGTTLKASGTPIGFVLGPAVTDGATHAYSLLWSFGGREFEEDGTTIALDSPETRACLEFFKDFYNDACYEDAFAWGEAGNNQAYNSGLVAATNNANTIYYGLANNAPDLVDVTSLGGALEGPAGAYQYMSMLFWGIPTYSANVEAAKAYLRDFYNLDFQAEWTAAGQGYNLPPFPGLDDVDAAWPSDPNLAAARTLPRTVRLPGYSGPFTTGVAESMNKFLIINMFANVAQGMDIQEAIDSTVDEMNVILNS